jgi:hypothetical protein
MIWIGRFGIFGGGLIERTRREQSRGPRTFQTSEGKMAEYYLNKWSVTHLSKSPWLAPECNPVCLQGVRDEDNRSVRTSPIDKVEGRIIRTESGSAYFLGEPDPEYLAYLESIGYDYDPENPIKDRRA